MSHLANQWRTVFGGTSISKFVIAYGEFVVAVVAFVVWLAYIPSVNIRNMTDLGIISALTPPILVTTVVVILAFCVAVARSKPHQSGLLLILLITIIMLFGLSALTEPEPRFALSYVHEGFSEYIRRTGTLATDMDARFSWPGFFIYSAFLPVILGLPNTLSFSAWASVIFNTLYCVPLYLIFTSLTSDLRRVWLALWLFCLGNWIAQDYWAPQAINLFMYLLIIGVLLGFFRRKPKYEFVRHLVERWLRRFGLVFRLANETLDKIEQAEPEPTTVSRRQRIGLALILFMIMFFVASSHQLTPFLVIFAVGALAGLNRITLRTFFLAAVILTMLWISYMTVEYLAGNIRGLLHEVGSVSSSVGSNVTSHISGSPEHQIIIYVRMLMTVALGITGMFGVVRRWFAGAVDIVPIVLIGTPFMAVALQSYGGELFLRIYLFSLPFMAFLTAGLFFARPGSGSSIIRLVALMVVGIGILIGFSLARYGNERMDYVTVEEFQAVNRLYDIAPPGSTLVSVTSNWPLRSKDIEQYNFVFATKEAYQDGVAGVRAVCQAAKSGEVFVLITRSQKAFAELFDGREPGWGDQFEQKLLSAPDFSLVFHNIDASIFKYTDGG